MAIANIVIKKTDNYEEALYEMKKYGAKMEQIIRSERKRAVIIVLGVFMIDAMIFLAGSSMG